MKIYSQFGEEPYTQKKIIDLNPGILPKKLIKNFKYPR